MKHYLLCSEFLSNHDLNMVLEAVREKQHEFVATTVSTGEIGYRKSSVLWHYHYMPVYEMFISRIEEILPVVHHELGMGFSPSDYELQITASGDGQYFKTHSDNGSDDTKSRRITFVHYFRLGEQQQFTGGDLHLQLPDHEITISPHHNSIIFFPSHLWHEVKEVSVPSGKFEDSRLTANGWIRD